MDNKPSKTVSRKHVRVLKMVSTPPGVRRRGTNMARLERQAARRRWLVISSAVAAALVAGVLIGRFLVP